MGGLYSPDGTKVLTISKDKTARLWNSSSFGTCRQSRDHDHSNCLCERGWGFVRLLEAISHVGDTAVDVYAIGTVQEEKGIRSMPTAAFAIEPAIGLAIDGSPTYGAHIIKHENICALGEGTGIYRIFRVRSMRSAARLSN